MKKAILLLCLTLCKTTLALQCTGLTTITEPKGAHWGSRIDINDAGAATVAWVQLDGSHRILRAAVRPNAASAWELTPLSPPSPIEAFIPFTAKDGTAAVIWKNGQTQYFFSKKPLGGMWSPQEPIEIKDYPKIRDVSFDPLGNPFVLASPENETKTCSFHIYSKQSISEAKLITASEQPINLPQLLRNKNGEFTALWITKYKTSWPHQTEKFDYQFHFSKYTLSKEWGSHTAVPVLMGFTDISTETASDISATTNEKGELAAMWSLFKPPAHCLFGIVVSGSSKIGDIKKTKNGYPESMISIDKTGHTVAAWIEVVEGKKVVYAIFKAQGQEWKDVPERLSNPNKNAEHLQIDYTDAGFVVVWGEEEKLGDNRFKRSIHGSTLKPKAEKPLWTPAVQLSPADRNCWYPSIAMSKEAGMITWTTHRKTTRDFQIDVADLLFD